MNSTDSFRRFKGVKVKWKCWVGSKHPGGRGVGPAPCTMRGGGWPRPLLWFTSFSYPEGLFRLSSFVLASPNLQLLCLSFCLYIFTSKWQSTPVLLPGNSPGQRSLVGYSPWSRKELDTTDWATSLHFTSHPIFTFDRNYRNKSLA